MTIPNHKIIIKLRGITREYALGKENVLAVLNGIDCEIYQGEFVAIMGPSGSGKSTLLNVIGCLDVPSAGDYWLEGELVSEKTEEELATVRSEKIGFIFQNFNLITEISALENVLVPQLYTTSAKENIEQATMLLEKVGLTERRHHKPAELSGGQRQRVAIARALINNPDIIIADEPTGNLDSKTGREILQLLTELHNNGKTLVLVTHDPAIGKMAERVIYIKDGKIVSEL
ncbi:MAG: macrolide ABC transporter ATP-binding protein [Candidatus Kerfeldbacteria bacterium RIFOXYA2_FULL_38_24]|uniref:Macrolide ABC transporter ATP-binding protein n=1 Tax=Candidatus Kerfeldbacteria bacterium RIFOXYB2_FULL_38_14 TaxID=1798547 RepID=A0A1G2B8U7_9BACT|nr:MAG: macrolide ABC transporter ATP-binding protein [Candidatus Kerfeldbacteria bacterium RIFOXYA2_FULL_38_24]OGY85633.1 MAG: macrolide ABC transporter ATP-binding protein [Candidatus Kerfeldbacteria bacterium RIFOXYB2_FULL_38_14]OGY89347.1 MAG: macrolide ABC transporter ATP-binding protein [Candidatus Kerfeldbacteria bacterium RIFOXYC2_FULL_38_9]